MVSHLQEDPVFEEPRALFPAYHKQGFPSRPLPACGTAGPGRGSSTGPVHTSGFPRAACSRPSHACPRPWPVSRGLLGLCPPLVALPALGSGVCWLHPPAHGSGPTSFAASLTWAIILQTAHACLGHAWLHYSHMCPQITGDSEAT